jgi:hypothetical protein
MPRAIYLFLTASLFTVLSNLRPGDLLSSLKYSLVAGVAIICFDQPTSSRDSPPLDEVLKRARAAVHYGGARDQTDSILVKGKANYQGLDCSYRLQFAPDGRFVQCIHGRLSETIAFDGTEGRGVDHSRTPRVLVMGDLEVPQLVVSVQTGRWLAKDAPLVVRMLDRQSDERHVALRIRTASGAVEADLFLDRTTWLPTCLTRRSSAGTESWEFQDFRRSHGLILPHRFTRIRGGLTDRYEITSVGKPPTTNGNHYQLDLSRPKDTRFDPAKSQPIKLKRSPTGHLFVRPKINGKDVGWFALDTGSGVGMTIAPSVADALDLPSFGKVLRGGAGKSTTGSFRQGTSFELGPLSIMDTVYVELPSEFVEAMKKLGMEFAGTCGYDLFSRAVAELDARALTLTLHSDTSDDFQASRWEPLLFNRKIPCVRCRFGDDREGIFQLDTGAGSSMVVFHAPAVEKLRLLEGRETTAIQVAGVGGNIPAHLGKIDWFSVGNHRFPAPTAIFVTAKEGALIDPHTTGTFGGDFLSPFRIVFDYPRQRIAFLEH